MTSSPPPAEPTPLQRQRDRGTGGEAHRTVAETLELIDTLDHGGPQLRSVLEVNRDAAVTRQGSAWEGPLGGVVVLVKDNIDVAGDGLVTSAGSRVLAGLAPSPRDAPVVSALRAAGALLLGSTNLSEWANWRSTHSSSGWSGRGGQTRNPYALDRSPGGSSSGSAAAVAAGLAPVALATETDGSILCPAALCGVVGIKPSRGLVPTGGVIPISPSQDTVGVVARRVRDAAAVLAVIAGRADLTLPPADAQRLRGTRIGVHRSTYAGLSAAADTAFEVVLGLLDGAGAVLCDPADVPTAAQLRESGAELAVLLSEFPAALTGYLASRPGAPADLAEVLARTEADPVEMRWCGTELWRRCLDAPPAGSPEHRAAVAESRRLADTDGLAAVFASAGLDLLVLPTCRPAWKIDLIEGDPPVVGSWSAAAVAGWPSLHLPVLLAHGLPVGVTLIARPGCDALLLAAADQLEALVHPETGELPRPTFPVSVDLAPGC